MKMSLTFKFLLALSIPFFLISCQDEGDVQITLQATHKGEAMALNQTYVDDNGIHFKLTKMQFYISDLTLVGADDGGIDEILLLELDGNGQAVIEKKVPAEAYNGISFGLGVKQSLNDSDPAEYDNSSPLSYDQNMYWTWALKYIFAKIEGEVDVDGDGLFEDAFIYHVGSNDFYKTTNVDVAGLDIEKKSTTRATVNIAIDKMFFGDSDFIDKNLEDQAHASQATFELAGRVYDNLLKSFTAK